jgi:hypothetical protein
MFARSASPKLRGHDHLIEAKAQDLPIAPGEAIETRRREAPNGTFEWREIVNLAAARLGSKAADAIGAIGRI